MDDLFDTELAKEILKSSPEPNGKPPTQDELESLKGDILVKMADLVFAITRLVERV